MSPADKAKLNSLSTSPSSTSALDWKDSVRVATTANITLSGLQTIDNKPVVALERVLVKNQIDGEDNGIYVVSSGAWSRSTDANTSTLVTAGLAVAVEEGDTYDDSIFILSTANPITLDTTPLVFTQFFSSPLATTTPADVDAALAAVGTGLTAARADHKHDIVTGSPVEISDSTNSDGTSTGVPLADHVHAHGNRGGGTLHAAATTLVNGFMSSADKTKLDGLPSAIVGSILQWGDSSVGASVTIRYLTPGYDAGTALIAPVQWRILSACTLQKLRIRHNTTAGNGNSVIYTVRKNGVATALTASIASTAADASNLVNTVSFAVGDLIDIEVTKALSVGTSPSNVMASLEMVG
jgi:phage-related tail fiber protein